VKANRFKTILCWILILRLIISVCVRRDNINKMGVRLASVRFINSLDFKIKNREPNQTRLI